MILCRGLVELIDGACDKPSEDWHHCTSAATCNQSDNTICAACAFVHSEDLPQAWASCLGISLAGLCTAVGLGNRALLCADPLRGAIASCRANSAFTGSTNTQPPMMRGRQSEEEARSNAEFLCVPCQHWRGWRRRMLTPHPIHKQLFHVWLWRLHVGQWSNFLLHFDIFQDCLGLHQVGVGARHCQQLWVRSALHEAPALHDAYPVGLPCRRQAMRHHYRRAASSPEHNVEGALNLLLALHVERACGLIEEQHWRVAHERPCDSDALLLAAAEL
mmetsp:Transcript_64558/g.163532  ORF Transcript_64558/g.163532 Transcript_64558/m.163532 type:complete len:275 (-) Transcript_64558:38-862(-)